VSVLACVLWVVVAWFVIVYCATLVLS